jgi:hypothetical protein
MFLLMPLGDLLDFVRNIHSPASITGSTLPTPVYFAGYGSGTSSAQPVSCVSVVPYLRCQKPKEIPSLTDEIKNQNLFV